MENDRLTTLKTLLSINILFVIAAFGLYIYALSSEAITLYPKFAIYPNGTNWICVVGFAIISLPAAVELVQFVKREIIKGCRYQDTQKTVTYHIDVEAQRVDHVTHDNRGFEKFVTIAVPIIGAGILVYFFGFFVSLGFTLYRIAMIIYISVQISRLKRQTASAVSANANTANATAAQSRTTANDAALREAGFYVDNTIAVNKGVFHGLNSVGPRITLPAKDLKRLNSIATMPEDTIWELPLDCGGTLHIYKQGFGQTLPPVWSNNVMLSMRLEIEKCASDCPALNKRRGDNVFIVYYSQNDAAGAFALNKEAEAKADQYIKELATGLDLKLFREAMGVHPVMLSNADMEYYTFIPISVTHYAGREYYICAQFEKIPGIADDLAIIITQKENDPDAFDIVQGAEADEIFAQYQSSKLTLTSSSKR